MGLKYPVKTNRPKCLYRFDSLRKLIDCVFFTTGSQVLSLSGSQSGRRFTFHDTEIRVVFTTDTSVTHPGFSINYGAVGKCVCLSVCTCVCVCLSICVFVYLSVYLVCLTVRFCLFVCFCLYISLSVQLSVCLSFFVKNILHLDNPRSYS